MTESPTAPAKRARQIQRSLRRRWDSRKSRLALILSGILHAVGLAGFLVYNSLSIRSIPAVPVFEMVPVEPKLRPLAPKTPEPPPPPEKVETRPPDAPKLTSKPKKPIPVAKHEPRNVRAAVDTSEPIKDTPRPTAELNTQFVFNVPSDPRLSFWASRVKMRVKTLWHPPEGIAVQGQAKTVVQFQVARDGTVSAVSVAQSSGNALLDQLGQQAILRLDQVPPIPENYPQDVLQVSYEFVYQGQ